MFVNFQHFLTELEINIKFPTCWDGVNVEDINGNHVTYSNECDGDSNECFDFDCPESHPVRMPEIHLYVRVLNYEGGAHVFSNDTDVRATITWTFSNIWIFFTGLPQRLLLWLGR